MEKQLYSSGQFAQICKVNKKTLFYYDEIDLFKPAIIRDNGYRYYTYEQIDTFSKIKALQSLGISLQEIKNQLHSDNLSEGIKKLYSQKQAIKRKINELRMVESALDQKLTDLEHFMKVGTNEVFIQDTPSEYLTLDKDIIQKGTFVNYLTEGYHSGVMFKTDKNILTKGFKYKKTKQKKDSNFIKIKGRFLGIYFHANDNSMMECAQQAYNSLINNEYLVYGEIYLEDVASDFFHFSSGNLPFKMTIKLDES